MREDDIFDGDCSVDTCRFARAVYKDCKNNRPGDAAMSDGKLKVVASGDYLHTMGEATPQALGFGAYDKAADRIDLRLLAAAPQTDAVPPTGLRNADALLMLGQYLPETSIAPAAERLTVVARSGVGTDKI